MIGVSGIDNGRVLGAGVVLEPVEIHDLVGGGRVQQERTQQADDPQCLLLVVRLELLNAGPGGLRVIGLTDGGLLPVPVALRPVAGLAGPQGKAVRVYFVNTKQQVN